MTIVLAGGSGFLGHALRQHLARGGHRVITLTRRAPASPHERQWTPDGAAGPWADALADADAIVNLAGEGIADKRWTETRKAALRTSRILPARSIASALTQLPERPRLVITSSAIGYYGTHGDEPIVESSPPGDDFLARLCIEWEREAAAAVAAPATKAALIRTGLVLHPDGGALKPMLLPFRLGVGGPLGTGRQFWSWIHLHDWVAMVGWLVESFAAQTREGRDPFGPELVNAFNATAPVPVTNAEFSTTLGRVLNRPAVLPAPELALRLALGEFAGFLTTGARVLPARATHDGFQFRFTHLEPALRNLLQR